MAGLKATQTTLDRKVLDDVAVHDPEAFAKVVTLVKDHLLQVGEAYRDFSVAYGGGHISYTNVFSMFFPDSLII